MPTSSYDLLTVGRVSMDLFAQNVGAPFEQVTGFDTSVGGSPVNIAIGASRLGLTVATLTAVGEDRVGDFVLRYLQDQGEPLSNVEVSALVPVSLRPEGTEEELGNRIGIFFVALPIDVLDPVDRLRELKRRMDGHKHSLEAPLVFAAMQAFGRAPSGVIKPAVDYLCTRATAVVTNVKGPQEQLYLAGAPLEAFMFWIPRYGGIGLGISIMSYAGEVRVGMISDKDTVSSPETIIAGFYDEFDALRTRALESPPSVQELTAKLDDALNALDGMLSDETGQ